VLDELANHVPHMLLVVARGVLERLVLSKLCLDFLLVHGHQLISQQLLHELGNHGLGLELASIVFLNLAQQLSLLIVVASDQQVQSEVLERHFPVCLIGVQRCNQLFVL